MQGHGKAPCDHIDCPWKAFCTRSMQWAAVAAAALIGCLAQLRVLLELRLLPGAPGARLAVRLAPPLTSPVAPAAADATIGACCSRGFGD